MRSVKEIERDLRQARKRVRELEQDLNAAHLAEFLRESGVPDGAPPVFQNNRGQLVLVDRFDAPFPAGHLIKKNGGISKRIMTLFKNDDFMYVGDIQTIYKGDHQAASSSSSKLASSKR